MNKDPFLGTYKFEKIKRVVWALEAADAGYLAKVFGALGWTSTTSGEFSYDGTTVVLQKVEELRATGGLREMTLGLNRPHPTAKLGQMEMTKTDSPPELHISFD